MHHVTDCIASCVRFAIPQPTEGQWAEEVLPPSAALPAAIGCPCQQKRALRVLTASAIGRRFAEVVL